MQHEASVSQVSAEQILHAGGADRSAGDELKREWFRERSRPPVSMEYSVELKRLIELEMEGSVG